MKNLLFLLILVLIFNCKPKTKNDDVILEVNQATIGKHLERLSSDEFMGRMPFTEGEVKTVNYLKDEFSKLGLEPGNGKSFYQDVPLIEITGSVSDKMIISGPNGDFNLSYFDDFAALTTKAEEEVNLENSELVFAGYGIVAPEYGWNDYEGIDWKGKTAVVLVNDPGFKSGDLSLFKGDEMTYYGRWTYKYEEAGRQGAAGIIIIHETIPASYGWNVIQSSNTGPQLNLSSNTPVTDIQGWITYDSANKLFEASNTEIKDYKKLARNKDFRPVPLGLKASVKIKNTIKRDISKNVIAILPGTDLKEEYIIYSAHWDHFGIGKPVNGDSIYNGAADNASGTAALLAIAETFKKGIAPKRSIVFLAVTAEEQGLLGSAYYAEHPIFPPEKTVANINMDGVLSPGRMKDLTIISYGHSEMDDYAKVAAENQGRQAIKNPTPEKGNFFRSDHFNFAKIGIPPLYAKGLFEHEEKGIAYAKRMEDNYRENRYHQPSDEYHRGLDLSGIQMDLQLYYEVGLRLANESYYPKWYDTSEFNSVRGNK
ncbi:M28 family metallopeptidase [Gaetbulibacter aquiaggeris]|uniref:M28 family metallopeptidase n=1 Tax=Gaetbulibacter aquiaggeris TaxID=1735373 RepID=A0ABW7MQ67_9FLAO